MNFIINKIIYVFNHPWLIVISLVAILGVQVSNLTQEVQNLKNEINPTYSSQEVRLPTMVMPPKQNPIPELSQEVHIPNMPTTNTKLPQE